MEVNPFYEKAINYMADQLNYLEVLIGRSLTPGEKENIHTFYLTLSNEVRSEFESKFDPLI